MGELFPSPLHPVMLELQPVALVKKAATLVKKDSGPIMRYYFITMSSECK